MIEPRVLIGCGRHKRPPEMQEAGNIALCCLWTCWEAKRYRHKADKKDESDCRLLRDCTCNIISDYGVGIPSNACSAYL